MVDNLFTLFNDIQYQNETQIIMHIFGRKINSILAYNSNNVQLYYNGNKTVCGHYLLDNSHLCKSHSIYQVADANSLIGSTHNPIDCNPLLIHTFVVSHHGMWILQVAWPDDCLGAPPLSSELLSCPLAEKRLNKVVIWHGCVTV